MSSNSGGTTWDNTDVTTINAAYLNTLVEYFLQPLLDEVTQLLNKGQSVGGDYTRLDDTLTVPAGGSNFKPAAELVNALKVVGGSVNADLTWLFNALTDTIDEIKTTVASMQASDDLNAEQMQTFLQDFSGVISDLGSSPSGAGGGAGSAGGGAGSAAGGGAAAGSGGGSSGSGAAGSGSNG